MTSAELAANRFRQYQVQAASVEDFLARYYKPGRYTGRGEEYAAGLLSSYQEEFDEKGWTFISHHDSVTGRVVSYYGPPAPVVEQGELGLGSEKETYENLANRNAQ